MLIVTKFTMKMMILKSIILGIVQGLTEFIPVSSSGHLVLLEHFLGFKKVGIFFEVLLHFSTVVAILVVFSRRVGKIIKAVFTSRIRMKGGHWIVSDKNLELFFYLLWASIPAAIVGIFLKSKIEKLFSSPVLVSVMLLLTGVVLFSTRFIKIKKFRKHNAVSSTLIGIAQAFAIIPGISRSGATISAGLWGSISREDSAEFSFILVIPAILGAMVIETKEAAVSIQEGLIGIYLAGAIAAFIFGLISLIVLLKIVKKGKLHFFAYYCWLVGAATLVLSLWKGVD